MPKVKLLVSRTSVSMNADPILNSCAGPARRRWRQASCRRSRRAARKTTASLIRNTQKPNTPLSTRSRSESRRRRRRFRPGMTELRHGHAIHAASPSIAGRFLRADAGSAVQQPLPSSHRRSVRFDLRGRDDAVNVPHEAAADHGHEHDQHAERRPSTRYARPARTRRRRRRRR